MRGDVIGRVAVVGIDVSGRAAPQITELAVLHLDQGVRVRGPLVWLVQPGRMPGRLRVGRRAELAAAPTWPEVAGQVVEALAGRTVVVHDPARYAIVSRHLPDWRPAGLLLTANLARAAWPNLAGYGLARLAAVAGWSGRPPRTAAEEARAVELLLRTLGGRTRVPHPRDMTESNRHERR